MFFDYVYICVSTRETPAGFSRTLHRQVKALHAELKAMGYPAETIYALLMDGMLRLASEDKGQDGVAKVLARMQGQ